jgi:hypothetical protein
MTKVSADIRLEVRKNSRFFQAVIKDSRGKWRRLSTKTADRDEAIQFAQQKLAEWSVMEKHGISTSAKTFGWVAKKYLDRLTQSIDAGAANESQKHYVGIANRWLVPFFGSKNIEDIGDNDLVGFDVYRTSELGRKPSKSTINKHNIVLRSIFDFAIQNKWMKRHQIPKLTIRNLGRASQRRGFFEPNEWDVLVRFLTAWRDDAKKYITKHKRDVLRSYAYLLVSSGIRPGKEAGALRWNDFQRTPYPSSAYPAIC